MPIVKKAITFLNNHIAHSAEFANPCTCSGVAGSISFIFRIRLDGTRLFKVHLDKTQQTNIEHKTDTFAAVYKKLTGKEVNFEFPEAYL